jgi:hypothetical protein
MDGAREIPKVVLETVRGGFLVSVTGEVVGRNVERVQGAILCADSEVPCIPPCHSKVGELYRISKHRFVYAFIENADPHEDSRLFARVGSNNRVVTWARISDRWVMSDVCLQVRGVESISKEEDAPTRMDYHQIDFPIPPQQVPNPNPPPAIIVKLGKGIVVVDNVGQSVLELMRWSCPRNFNPVVKIAARVCRRGDPTRDEPPTIHPELWTHGIVDANGSYNGSIQNIRVAEGNNSDQNLLVSWSIHKNNNKGWILCKDKRPFEGVS